MHEPNVARKDKSNTSTVSVSWFNVLKTREQNNSVTTVTLQHPEHVHVELAELDLLGPVDGDDRLLQHQRGRAVWAGVPLGLDGGGLVRPHPERLVDGVRDRDAVLALPFVNVPQTLSCVVGDARGVRWKWQCLIKTNMRRSMMAEETMDMLSVTGRH
jgi:hypothetical protein